MREKGGNGGAIARLAGEERGVPTTLGDFVGLVHVYPTMAEALKIAAISRFKDPSKLSCCAE